MFEVFFYTMAVISVTLQFVCQWYFANGDLKVSYPLTIVLTLCYIAMDIGMVMYDTALGAVLIFSIANLWTLLMCSKGMIRIKEQEKEEKEENG